MKNNKKGFTLIELLAVIVILAIITVLATRTLLPLFSNAGKDGFAINANEVRNVSADLMSLYTFKNDSLTSANLKKNLSATGGCVCISSLKEEGLIEISDEYYGKVVITQKGNGFEYSVTMSNDEYKIENQTGSVSASDVSTGKLTGLACGTGSSVVNCQ